ncbi:collagen alpha-1(VIII) chain-like [Pygocentrus nattereri]|uniref:collagen alpha-1(VIII) chain-like n=1 Tax=Pygocentrus nattereri TaxID=42514 RepID=UPI001891D91E|nr:collagen alpha-1(VIII) chain-like [Pygocentrus nattereri]
MEQKLDHLMTHFSDVMEEVRGELREMKKLQDLEKRLKNVEEMLEEMKKEKEKKVAFSASLLASGEGYTGPMKPVPTPLIYKKVFSNYGNGYNPDTGVFTAPIKGVYFFRFYAHCQGGTTMAVSLYKNDERQCSVFSWKPAANGNATNGTVLTLEKGDRIYTKLWDETWVFDDTAGYTSFSGFLLFPL